MRIWENYMYFSILYNSDLDLLLRQLVPQNMANFLQFLVTQNRLFL